MTELDKDSISAAFEEELSSASLPVGYRKRVVADAARRRRARAGESHPVLLAAVAFVLTIAIVATLVVIAKAPHKTIPGRTPHAQTISSSEVNLGSISMFAAAGWAEGSVTTSGAFNHLLRTRDGARTWLDVTPALAKGEAVAAYFALDANRAWLVTSSVVDGSIQVYRTADGGATWSSSPGPSLQLVSPPLLFTDGMRGWLAAAGEPTSEYQDQPVSVARTSDAGSTWSIVSVTAETPTAGAMPMACGKQGMSFRDGETGWITGGCLGGVTFETTSDGGQTWKAGAIASPDGRSFFADCDAGPCSLTAPRFATATFAYMVLHDYDAGGGHRSTLYVSHDGGATWSPMPLPGGDASVTMLDQAGGFAALGDGTPGRWLARTDDGGRTWRWIKSSVNLQSAVLDCVSTQACWALSPLYSQPDATTHLFATQDGGVTWNDLGGPQPSPSPSPSAPGAPSLGREWQFGFVSAMAVTSDAVFALYTPTGTQGPLAGASNVMLARVDRSSGKLLTAGPFPGALTITTAGSAVWLGHSPSAGGPDANTLIEVEESTLKIIGAVQLPGSAGNRIPIAAITGSPTRVWLAYGSTLYELDAADGHVLRSATLAGVASSISLDPTGSRLYIGSDRCGAGVNAVVSEWNTSTLGRIASVETGGGCLGGPQVSAASDSVWVSYATGNLGAVDHLAAGDLSQMPNKGGPHSNAVQVVVAAGVVWMLDGGAVVLACLDPHVGAARATWDDPGGMTVAGDSTGMFLGTYAGLYVLNVDPRCSAAA